MGKRFARLLPILTLLGVSVVSVTASAQQQAAQAQSSGGGASSGGNMRHLSSTGVGMAVGRSAGGNVVAYNGFLARAVGARDTQPPVFDPPPVNLQAAIGANAQACSATVAVPAVRVVDNRDPAPVITAALQTNPVQMLNPAGQMVNLAPGSYDVLLTATDRRGNVARASYRIIVADGTVPTLANVPDPTPIGREAEAAAPAGTAVNVGVPRCSDVCDANPTLSSNAPVRYPVGDTNVDWVCVDAGGNRAAAARTVVRVRDRTAPAVAGGAPQAFAADCNNPAGSLVRVPGVAWQDNADSANQLTYSLVVDPAGANQAFDPIPATVTLTGGPHVLRYIARDRSGNVGRYDLNVNVSDVSAPRVAVLNAPQTGWYNQDADVQVRITDNCSTLVGGMRVVVDPPAQAQAINGDVLTLRYTSDGIINLRLTVTDGANNEVTDNSVAFGIDRGPPSASVVVPSQIGVVANNQVTWPLFAVAETLALNVGADDPSDGVASGVLRVQVFLDPDGQGRPSRTLADRTFQGQGAPTRGAAEVGNIRCTDNRAGDAAAVCNADGEIELRRLPIGPHVVRTVVTDFAGSVSTVDARFTNANLFEGLDVLSARMGLRLQQGGLPPAVAAELQQSLEDLEKGSTLAQREVPNSPYGTPLFLGSALKAVQDGTTDLDQAIQASLRDAPQFEETVLGYVSLLHRIAWSDLELYREYVEDRNLPAGFVGGERFLLAEYSTDMANSEDWLAEMTRAMEEQDWNASAAASLECFFGLKSADSGWMMNYGADFDPDPDVYLAEYERGRNILEEVRLEMAAYPRGAGGSQKMEQMRDDLDLVVGDLDRLIENDFDSPNGLSDQVYVEDLINLQLVAASSQTAANQGAWVRNYQWALMQVVRYMAFASTAKAIRVNQGARRNWPLFQFASQRITEGVGYLRDRRVSQAIDLYLDQASTCSIAAVYHCHYLTDEDTGGRVDTDEPYLADVVEPCWDIMLRPDEWAGAPPAINQGPPPACRFGDDVRLD